MVDGRRHLRRHVSDFGAGGLVTELADWRAVFVVQAPVALLAVPGAWRARGHVATLGRSPRAEARIARRGPAGPCRVRVHLRRLGRSSVSRGAAFGGGVGAAAHRRCGSGDGPAHRCTTRHGGRPPCGLDGLGVVRVRVAGQRAAHAGAVAGGVHRMGVRGAAAGGVPVLGALSARLGPLAVPGAGDLGARRPDRRPPAISAW